MRFLPLPAILLALGLLRGEVPQPSADAGPPPLAQIEEIVVGGTPTLEPASAEVRIVRGQQIVPARPALPLFEDDEILTGPDVTVTILCLEEVAEEDKTVFVGAASQIRIRSQRSIFLILGRILANIRGRFDVATARATLGSRSTEFEVRVGEDGATHLVVLEGIVDVQRSEEAPAAEWRPDRPLDFARGGPMSRPRLVRAALSTQRLPQPAAVGRLEEVTIQKGDPATKVEPTSEDRVRGVLGWTTEAALVAQPATAAKRLMPHFESAADRARAFRQAKFDAIWRRDPGSYETLGKVYSDWEEGAKAVEAFNKELELTPGLQESGSFLANVGEALRMKGRLREAEEHLVRARRAEPDNARAVNGLGNVYFAQAAAAQDTGAYDAAAALLQKCLGLYAESRQGRLETPRTPSGVAWANDGEARLTLGDIARQQSRLDEAAAQYAQGRQAFIRASGADPRYVFAAIGRADAARRIGAVARLRGDADQAQKAYREAESEYRQILAAQPNVSAAHLGLGDLFVETGRREAAIESYTRAAMLRPDQPAPHLRLGLVLADHNPRAAAQHAQTYMQLEQPELKRGQRLALASRIASAGSASALVAVPNVLKLSASAARDALTRAGLVVGDVSTQTGPPGDGTVVDQSPKPNASVKRGSSVDLVLARGAGPVGEPPASDLRVPKVEDLGRDEARRIIEGKGFRVGRIETRESSKAPGTVLDQKPDANRRASAGAPIDLVVAVPRMRTVEVPDLVGDSRARAEQKLRERGLLAQPITERASCEEPGTVVAQEPGEDARVQSGTAVSLVVASAGPRPVRVPRLVGLHLADVERAFREQPLKIGKVDRRQSDQERPDTILGQTPRPDTLLAPGCPVDVVVAIAVPRVRVPTFIGMTEAEARRTLGLFGAGPSGLRLGSVQQRQTRGTPGTVVGQDPPPGSVVEVGTPVHLVVVARREAPPDDLVTVPDVRRRLRREAEAILQKYGLRVEVQVRYMRQQYKEGEVISQSHLGERVPRGTVIQLVVATTIG